MPVPSPAAWTPPSVWYSGSSASGAGTQPVTDDHQCDQCDRCSCRCETNHLPCACCIERNNCRSLALERDCAPKPTAAVWTTARSAESTVHFRLWVDMSRPIKSWPPPMPSPSPARLRFGGTARTAGGVAGPKKPHSRTTAGTASRMRHSCRRRTRSIPSDALGATARRCPPAEVLPHASFGPQNLCRSPSMHHGM